MLFFFYFTVCHYSVILEKKARDYGHAPSMLTPSAGMLGSGLAHWHASSGLTHFTYYIDGILDDIFFTSDQMT